MTRRAIVLCGVIAGLLAGPSPVSAQPSNCSILNQNTFVRDTMNEFYLWYQFNPAINPVRYSSPQLVLDAMRYRPLDSSFSFITSRASNDAFYSDSQFIGFGLTTMTSSEMRVLQVYEDSPASEGGLARGDRILQINGRTVASLIASGEIDAAFGASQIGVQASVVFASRDGVEHQATMTKRLVTIPTVSLTRVFQIEGRTVGYLLFRNFVTPSIDALNVAFESLKEAGATELVLDLRYNGGGLVDVATHLASLIGGKLTEGQAFATYQHNERNTRRNETIRFASVDKSLSLSRLFVITTRSSASASELVINGLRPFIPVVVIGDRTYGKPVGQYGFEFCDKVLAAVSFALVNADGQGNFFDGIAADCGAADDIEHDLGFADEASLAEALHYIRTGSCSASAETARTMRARTETPRAVGWQALVNAY